MPPSCPAPAYAESVAGSFHHFARNNDPTFFNAPISIHSTRIPVVCSSVHEVEYGGTFAAAKVADLERQVLSDFGYPQSPTTIHCDNEVAVGLANRNIKPKMSKSCDMRIHWLQDRVRRRSAESGTLLIFHEVSACELTRSFGPFHRLGSLHGPS
jgi:hypothetical protein